MFSSRTSKRLVLVAIVVLCLSAAAASQTRFVATFGNDAGPNDCLSSGSPCATIAHAISVAIAGDTVSIGAGTYTELGLIVDKNLTFIGAGAATTIIQAHALPNTAANRVFTVNGGVTASMSDLTIRNGKAPTGTTGSDCTSFPCLPSSNGGIGEAGGGILNGGILTLTNMVLSGNRAGKGGTAGNISCPVGACNNIGGEGGTGGGVSTTGSLTVSSSTLTDNHAGDPGNAGSTAGCGGSCTSNPGDTGNGGALYGATVSVDSSLFTGNSGDDGGAIQQGAAAITITNSTFSQNSASNTGGAINCNGAVNPLTCSISGSTINDNFTSGTQGGTVALFGLSTKNISNTTITGNDSLGDAGGILANAGTVNITFVTISDNIADANNSTTGDGGGIRNEVATVNLKNSIIADNSDDGGEAPQISGVIASQGYNHVESTTGGTFTPTTGDVIGSEDGLAPLANNGGPTQTQGLYASSQAIDQIPNGTNGCGIAPFNVDQRGPGFPRPVNSACDKGAFEGNIGTAAQEIDVQGGSPLLSIPDGDTTPSTTDGTDFGSTAASGGTVVHTFTIHNSGTGSLTISNPIINGTNPLDFAVTATPISPVPSGGTTTFQVTFDPIAVGLRTATVTIINNDANESPYDFVIQGTGSAADTTAPVLTYTPIASTFSTANPTLSATITDVVGVTGATIFWRVNGGGFVSNPCTGPITGTSQNGTWNCIITGAPHSTSAISYYVTAQDAAANTGSNPAAGAAEPNLFTIGGATIPPGTYANMSLGNGASLGGNVAVSGNLTLGGIVNAGANTLTLGCSATVSGAGLSAYVVGNVAKAFCGVASFSYPVGTVPDGINAAESPSGVVVPTEYSPVLVSITGGTVGSSLSVEAFDAPLLGFNPATSLSHNWGLTETGDLTANLTFTYLDPGDVNGNEADYRVYSKNNLGVFTNWCPGAPCVNTGANTAGTITGVSTFSRWTAGQNQVPTAAGVNVSGRVTTPDGRGLRNARVVMTDSQGVARTVTTSSFGFYQFDDVMAGEVYVIGVVSKQYRFAPRLLQVFDSVTGEDFAGLE